MPCPPGKTAAPTKPIKLHMTNWTDKKFDDLTPHELYAILRLRSEVFVVEQNCVFLDMDGKDQVSHHLMAWQDDNLVAYARIVPPGISYREFSIGRIVSSPAVRKQGIGRVLVSKSIQLAYSLHGKGIMRIGAQYYLRGFYESFGFEKASDIYLEDGIEHIEMLLLMKD
jgi:ElaA protein